MRAIGVGSIWLALYDGADSDLFQQERAQWRVSGNADSLKESRVMPTLKLLMVGPKEAGKTMIANFVTEQSERLGGQDAYKPTIGVRILEMEKNKTNIELWDVSGDQNYDACWPAISKDASGVILVYNPESMLHESEAMLWYEFFMQTPGLDPAQCLIFEHSSSSTPKRSSKLRIPPAIRAVPTTLDAPNVMKNEFDKFVLNVQDMLLRQAKTRK